MTNIIRKAFEVSGLAMAAYGLIILIWVVRMAVEGFAGPVFSDAGAYLYAGDSLLDGNGLTAPDGNLFHSHGPVGPVLIALASHLLGTDPFTGPKLIIALIFLASLLGAVRIGQLLGGDVAALFTAAGIAAVPFIWSGFMEVLIDQPQLGLMVATILLLWRPSPMRAAAAGVVFGVCVLTKETSGLALVMPLAWMGALPRSEFKRVTLIFLGAVFVTAAWWWALVWAQSGVVFPFDQVSRVGSRSTTRFGIGVDEVATLMILLLAWAWFIRRERSRPQARLVIYAGAGVIAPALLAVANQLDFRQLLLISVLSCVAGGVALAGWLEDESRKTRRIGRFRVFTLAAGAIAACAVCLTARAQLLTRPGEPLNLGTVVRWLDSNTVEHERIAMTYMYRREILSRTDHQLRLGTVIDLRNGLERTNESRNTPLTLSGCGYCRRGETASDRGEDPTEGGWIDPISIRRALVDRKNRLIVISTAPSLALMLLEHFPAVHLRYRDRQGIDVWVVSVDHEKLPGEGRIDRIIQRNAEDLLVSPPRLVRPEAGNRTGSEEPGSS